MSLHLELPQFLHEVHSSAMGVKGGIKNSHVHVRSSSSHAASTPAPSPTRSSLPPASSLEVSSQGPPSPTYEHSEPSEGFPVVDLSSREEDTFLDTSRDEETT
jgi:hypothetical protein